MKHLTIEVGQHFGKWTVVALAPTINRRTRCVCRCECGTQRVICNTNLKLGYSKSCGCIRGILCGTCNSALGMFKESTDVVNQAAAYLNEWELSKQH